MEQKGLLMFAHINTVDEIKGKNPALNQVSIVPLF